MDGLKPLASPETYESMLTERQEEHLSKLLEQISDRLRCDWNEDSTTIEITSEQMLDGKPLVVFKQLVEENGFILDDIRATSWWATRTVSGSIYVLRRATARDIVRKMDEREAAGNDTNE